MLFNTHEPLSHGHFFLHFHCHQEFWGDLQKGKGSSVLENADFILRIRQRHQCLILFLKERSKEFVVAEIFGNIRETNTRGSRSERGESPAGFGFNGSAVHVHLLHRFEMTNRNQVSSLLQGLSGDSDAEELSMRKYP